MAKDFNHNYLFFQELTLYNTQIHRVNDTNDLVFKYYIHYFAICINIL